VRVRPARKHMSVSVRPVNTRSVHSASQKEIISR